MYYVWGMFFADWALCSTKHVAIKQLFNTGKTKFKIATKTGHCRKIIELEHNSFLNWSFIGHGIQHITIWLYIDIKTQTVEQFGSIIQCNDIVHKIVYNQWLEVN